MGTILPLLFMCLRGPSCSETQTPGRLASSAPTSEELSDALGLILAAAVAGGVDASGPRQPTLFAGVKIGWLKSLKGGYPGTLDRNITLDLGYDRMRARNGFSGELSLMLPVARFPAPRTPAATYARVYVEPGVGYRVSPGSLGSYASAKAMLALFSDDRLTRSDAPPSMFLEIQRRFPLAAPLHGDTRIVIGLMLAVCHHCGLN
jgi:hypothetical protein